jgi:dephospho-CoA kinase
VSKWPGKHVIGLTGNIGVGKSVVRRMLEHLGAHGIDADALARRAVAKGAPGYQQVIETFGRWVLLPDGEIDRAKLGRLVFSQPDALAQLEAIVHPLVDQAVDILVRRSFHQIIVIEAIKLLESNLKSTCDSIWVTSANKEVQLKRLMAKRNMTRVDALQRITAQASQSEKEAQADVIIHNNGTFEETWNQVVQAWQTSLSPSLTAAKVETAQPKKVDGTLIVERARPAHSEVIADLFNAYNINGNKKLSRMDVMEAFGEKAFLLLLAGDRHMGVMGWQVENLIARTTDIALSPKLKIDEALSVLLKEMEKASKDLLCEVSLVVSPPNLGSKELWQQLGYQRRHPKNIGVKAWEEAAAEAMKPGMVLWIKRLRESRILRPF